MHTSEPVNGSNPPSSANANPIMMKNAPPMIHEIMAAGPAYAAAPRDANNHPLPTIPVTERNVRSWKLSAFLNLIVFSLDMAFLRWRYHFLGFAVGVQ